MTQDKKIKRAELHNSLYIFTVIIVMALQSCNAERKALKPYKAVLNDVDTNFQAKKDDLGGRYCATHFPIEVKTITKDSIVNKIIKVQDAKEINRLKTLLAAKCPAINVDSIYNSLPLDTIYVEHWRTKEVTKKDSFQLREYSKQIATLNQNINSLNATLYLKQAEITKEKLNVLDAERTSDKWRLRFFALLFVSIVYWGLRLIAKYRTLPFKL